MIPMRFRDAEREYPETDGHPQSKGVYLRLSEVLEASR